MPPGMVAQRALNGCTSCNATTAPAGVGDLAPVAWYSPIPLWAKILGGLVLAGGVSYAIYRIVR
jgi:hypothetical protein